jgi:hypothetical protein
MKNLILLSLFLLGICPISTAQNWAPLPSGDPNFIVDSALQRLVCIPIDSLVEQGTVKTYHIKRDFTVNYDTLTFDKSYFLGYSVSFDTVTGSVQSQADWPYRLEVYAPKDSSWSFNATLTATVDSVVATTTFGQEDSLKYISLDTALSQIILSKAFGIMQFPQLDTAGEAYTLKGVQNQAGDYQPGFDFFYDFDVNDSIQFYYNLWIGKRGESDYAYTIHSKYKIRVSEIQETNDSIYYIFKGLNKEEIWDDTDGKKFTNVEYKKIDSLILAVKKGGWFSNNHGVFQQFTNEPFLNALGIQNRVFFANKFMRFYYYDYLLSGFPIVLSTTDFQRSEFNDDKFCSKCAFNKVNDSLFVTEFNRGFPALFNDIAYFKDRIFTWFYMENEVVDHFRIFFQGRSLYGKISGEFLPDSEFLPTGINSSTKSSIFILKQNSQSLQIDSQDEMSSISLIDVQGKRLFQSSPQSPFEATLQLGAQPNGIYLVEVVFENGKRAVKKIVR